MLTVRVLGCGTSTGLPLIGNIWGTCDPAQPRNRRTRASVLVKSETTTLLVDTSPDVRAQLLEADVGWVDAVVFTHIHADHTHGINDIANLSRFHKKEIPFYGDKATLEALRTSFGYIFPQKEPNSIYKTFVDPHVITPQVPFRVGDIDILPLLQDHGLSQSLGFRMGGFAYSTDVHRMTPQDLARLQGIDVWVVDALGYVPHSTHSHLDQTLEWISVVRPRRAYLTHLSARMDYQTLCQTLPVGVEPAYDGLEVKVAQ